MEGAHLVVRDALRPGDALVQAADVVRVAGGQLPLAVVVRTHRLAAQGLGFGAAVAQGLQAVPLRAFEGLGRKARFLQHLQRQAQQCDEVLALALDAQREALARAADAELALEPHRLVDDLLAAEGGIALAQQAGHEAGLVGAHQGLRIAPAQADLADHLVAARLFGQQRKLQAGLGQAGPLRAFLQRQRAGVQALALADGGAGQRIEPGAAVGHAGNLHGPRGGDRLVACQRAVVRLQVAARHAAHVVELERLDLANQLEDQSPVAGGDRLGEQLRQLLGLLEQLAVAERELTLHALELLLGQLGLFALFQRLEQRALELVRRTARGVQRDDVEQPGIVTAAAAGADLRRQLLGFDEALVQRATGPLGEHLTEQGEGGAIRVGKGRCVVADQGQRRAADATHHHGAFAVLRRLHGVGERLGRRRVLQSAEALVDLGQQGGRVELAGDDERRIVRPVMRLVEPAQRLDRHVLDIGLGADGRLAVGMEAVGGGHQALAQQLHGLVLALLQFVQHHAHLFGQILGLHARTLHALGLQLQQPGEGQIVGVEGAEVIRAVGGGAGIEAHAALAHALRDVGHRRRALEQQVLEQVRHAGLTCALVAAADAVDQIDQRGGGGRVVEQQQLQAVGQPVFLDAFELAQQRRRGQRRRRERPPGAAAGLRGLGLSAACAPAQSRASAISGSFMTDAQAMVIGIAATSPLAMRSRQSAGPVVWALVPPASTATVTGMSTTSNS